MTINRRRALGAMGLGTFVATTTKLAAEPSRSESMSVSQPAQDDEPGDLDKRNIMEAGLTEEEAECWRITAQAAGAFFRLPELHPSDNQEIAEAVHVIQNKLLGRPTYRRYLEISKASRGERSDDE